MHIGDEITKGRKFYKILEIFHGRRAKKQGRNYANLIKNNWGYATRVLSNKDKTMHYAVVRLEVIR